jgi:hypothetical protein
MWESFIILSLIEQLVVILYCSIYLIGFSYIVYTLYDTFGYK